MSGFDRTLRVRKMSQGFVVIENSIGPNNVSNAEFVRLTGWVGPHNPHTFAAAPELLAACKLVAESGMRNAAYDACIAAIAAATGEQS